MKFLHWCMIHPCICFHGARCFPIVSARFVKPPHKPKKKKKTILAKLTYGIFPVSNRKRALVPNDVANPPNLILRGLAGVHVPKCINFTKNRWMVDETNHHSF